MQRGVSVSAAVLIAMSVTGQAHAQADGDAAKGKTFFARCAVCHSVDSPQAKIGPTLNGFIGRKAGAVPGFAYSTALKNSGIVWDRANFDAFIANPRAKVPGNKMPFVGVPNPADRANLWAYLQSAGGKK